MVTDSVSKLSTHQLKLEAESKRTRNLDWSGIIAAAKALADSFLNDEIRTKFGQTSLITDSSRLLELTITENELESQIQLLRVIGNLCFDHDVNRTSCHQHDILTKILAIISTNRIHSDPILPFSNLLALKSAVGALLNLSMNSDLIKASLRDVKALSVLSNLIDPISCSQYPTLYTPGSWSKKILTANEKERIHVGSTVVEWALDIMVNVLVDDKSSFPPSSINKLVHLVLSSNYHLLDTVPELWSTEEMEDLIETDVHLAKTASSLLEKLALDLDSVKQELAINLDPLSSSSLLVQLLTFIELAAPKKFWKSTQFSPIFSAIKAAAIRTVIESPNDDTVMIALFKDESIVRKLVEWIEKPVTGREDLIICASHMLGALTRNDEHSISLVNQFHVAAPIASILASKSQEIAATSTSRPGETAQILFGLVSLLRHLAIPSSNRRRIAATRVMQPLATLLRSEFDIVGPLQAATIAVLKHLLNSDPSNSLEFVGILSTSDSIASSSTVVVPPRPPMEFLLELLGRTEDVRLRSETTRVFINGIRALFSTNSSAAPTLATSAYLLSDIEKQSGRNLFARVEIVKALTELVRLSATFPMLVNEAIVGLTLLSGSSLAAANLVYHSLFEPSIRSALTEIDPAVDAPTKEATTANRAYDVLSHWFREWNVTEASTISKSSTIRIEMIYNALTLTATLLKMGGEENREDLLACIRCDMPRLMESFKITGDQSELPKELLTIAGNKIES